MSENDNPAPPQVSEAAAKLLKRLRDDAGFMKGSHSWDAMGVAFNYGFFKGQEGMVPASSVEKLKEQLQTAIVHSNCYCPICKSIANESWSPYKSIAEAAKAATLAERKRIATLVYTLTDADVHSAIWLKIHNPEPHQEVLSDE